MYARSIFIKKNHIFKPYKSILQIVSHYIVDLGYVIDIQAKENF